jgi:hypothetical protein
MYVHVCVHVIFYSNRREEKGENWREEEKRGDCVVDGPGLIKRARL